MRLLCPEELVVALFDVAIVGLVVPAAMSLMMAVVALGRAIMILLICATENMIANDLASRKLCTPVKL